MAHGAWRCMYCDDSLGTDIDHFQPLKLAPLRAFVWANHLLACSNCNSNSKRDQYPLASDGTCLLIDPTTEDPADHLVLMLRTGVYGHLTDKGEATIDVFHLNRPDLVAGRKDAYCTARSVILSWYEMRSDGDPDADSTAKALLRSPFVDVVYAMARLAPHVAEAVIGARFVPAVQQWRSVYGTVPAARVQTARIGAP
ncbi:HNH endonuclease [Streptomyces sp. NPDC047082]|uniref:HNH endonuclease n=1 Tax=Streptomyces sp. NPDC047082 TaxID=3155259 RepID=UPI0033BFB7F0